MYNSLVRNPRRASGQTRPIAQKPMKASWRSRSFVSKVHRKKPHLKPVPRRIQRSNAGKWVICSRVEHVFADQKLQLGLFIRTVGVKRATMDRTGQYPLQHAPLPLPGADQRYRVAIQSTIPPALLQTQSESHHAEPSIPVR